MKTNYHLEKSSGIYNNIKGLSKIAVDKKSPGGIINGIKVNYDLSGDGSNVIKTDKNTGWVSSSISKQQLAGNVVIPNSKEVPGGAKIPITVIVNTVAKSY